MYERRWIPFVKVRLQQNGFSALLRVRVALARLRLVLRVVPTEKKTVKTRASQRYDLAVDLRSTWPLLLQLAGYT